MKRTVTIKAADYKMPLTVKIETNSSYLMRHETEREFNSRITELVKALYEFYPASKVVIK